MHPAETGRGLHDLKHQSRGVVDVELVVSGWTAAPIEIGTPESAPFDARGDALRACLETVDDIRRRLPDWRVNIGRLDAGDQPGTVPTARPMAFPTRKPPMPHAVPPTIMPRPSPIHPMRSFTRLFLDLWVQCDL